MTRPIAKLLVPINKIQYRLYDDPDSDKRNEYMMNVENNTIYDEKLVFKNNRKIFSLRGDVLKMITNYKFNKTDSPDAKLIIDFVDEVRFSYTCSR